jgi:hypothetical protein
MSSGFILTSSKQKYWSLFTECFKKDFVLLQEALAKLKLELIMLPRSEFFYFIWPGLIYYNSIIYRISYALSWPMAPLPYCILTMC